MGTLKGHSDKKVIKIPPATTVKNCAKYRSRSYTCSCKDYARGGSYVDFRTNETICKHMYAIRFGKIDVIDVRSLERGITREEYLENIGRAIEKTWPSKKQQD